MNFADLTPEQKNVVKAPLGNIKCVAVAGAGKTSTLSFRVLELVNNGALLNEILLLTFSNKAAKEMTKRVSYLLPDTNFTSETFHSFGLKLCKRFYKELGISKDFKILKNEEKKSVMEAARKKILSTEKISSLPKYNVLLEMYSGAINHNIPFSDYIIKYYNLKKPEALEAIKLVFREYILSKQENSFLDFDDLLLNTYDLLSNARVKRTINKEFKHIIVDEYQDINWIQYEIIKKLNGNNSLFVIGDAAQCIYEWRGANSSHINNFENEFKNAQVYHLTTNFRSTQEILDFAEDCINHNNFTDDVKLQANNFSGDLPTIFSAPTPKDAYEIVAEDISKNYLSELSEVAILLRYNAECSDVKRVFDKIGIPATIDKTKNLTQTKHFKDIRNFLNFLENPNEETCENILSLIGIPKSKHPQTIKELKKVNFDFSLAKSSDSKVEAVYKLMAGLFYKNKLHLDEKIDKFFEVFYKDNIIKNRTNHEQIFEDIEHITKQCENFADFTDFDNYYTINDDEEASVGPSVKIMTLHKAKGLEFKYVYILGLNDDIFPKLDASKEEIENERKLFYVGCTRAKESLIIGFYQTDVSGQSLNPSMFLEEIDQNLYEFD